MFPNDPLDQQNFKGGFTVLMAVYRKDAPDLFERAVDSVFHNTLSPNQVVLVADGTLSDALEVALSKLQARHDNRIEVLRLPENRGLAHALNAGLRRVRYPWVVRADADDYNLSGRFEVLANLSRLDPALGLIGGAILEVDECDRPLAIRAVPCDDASIRQFAASRSPFNHMTVAFSLRAVMDVGGYPIVHLKEDYALWCLLLADGVRAANSPEILVRATTGTDLFKRRGGWKYAKAEWDMQRILVACGLKGKLRALVDGMVRAVIFLGPAGVREKIYHHFLREQVACSGQEPK